jgi:ligand-binding sensor domain-containing protein
LSNGSISDLVFEPSSAPKKLWLGTNVGLSSFEFGTSSISTVNYNTNSPGILSDTLSALGIDAANIKYIGTSKGLSILNLDKWNHYFGRIGDGEPLLNYKISSVSVGGKGYIYAATQGGGVSRFKYTADAISGATTYNFPWAWGLPSDTVYTVVAIDTCQWYGTRRGAAYHTSENTKTDWVTYKRADGLICDSVYTIAKDLSGNIWFGTFNGVSKLTGDKWQSFTTKDGLIANKVNSIAVDLDGSIWFGTDEGISHFANNHWSNF